MIYLISLLVVVGSVLVGFFVAKALKGDPFTKVVYMESLMKQYKECVNIKKSGLLALENDMNGHRNE